MRFLHIQHDSVREVTFTHILQRIMMIIELTPRITLHPRPYSHFYVTWRSVLCTPQMRSQIKEIWSCNSRLKPIISETASSYPCCASAQLVAWNYKVTASKREEQKAVFVTIQQINDIDGYTIRMRRSVWSQHPIVYKYTILNRMSFDTSCLHSIFRLLLQ